MTKVVRCAVYTTDNVGRSDIGYAHMIQIVMLVGQILPKAHMISMVMLVLTFTRVFWPGSWFDGQTPGHTLESDLFQSTWVDFFSLGSLWWSVHPDMLYFGHFLTIFEHARNNDYVFKRQFHLHIWSDGQTVVQTHVSNPFGSIRVGILFRDVLCKPEIQAYELFTNLFSLFYPRIGRRFHQNIPTNLSPNQVG